MSENLLHNWRRELLTLFLILNWKGKSKPLPAHRQSGVWLSCVEGGLCWESTHATAHLCCCFDLQTLEFETVSAANAHKAAAWAVKRVCDPSVLYWPSRVTPKGHCAWCGFTDLQDSFSSHTFASPRLWVSLLGVIPGRCLCFPLACLLHLHETDPRERLSILNVSLAQWFLACSHNYGQWGVVIHKRIQLLSTSWQPGGRWVWLPHWLVRFISLCKNCHVPFWCCSLVPLFPVC